MKCLVMLLAVASVAQGGVRKPAAHAPPGYLQRSVALAEQRRQLEQTWTNGGSRIAGGQPSDLGQFPYLAGLIIDIQGIEEGVGICSAVLVRNTRLVTAAHCWFDGVNQAWRYEVVLGSVRLFSGGVRQFTSNVITHINYNPRSSSADVQVVFIPTPVEFNDYISPINFAQGIGDDFIGEHVIAAGFGLTGDNDTPTTAQHLRHMHSEVVSFSECRRTFSLPWAINFYRNICTRATGTVGTCRGDSGGPLVVMRNHEPALVGLTTFSHLLGCQIDTHAVFTKLEPYIFFINNPHHLGLE